MFLLSTEFVSMVISPILGVVLRIALDEADLVESRYAFISGHWKCSRANISSFGRWDRKSSGCKKRPKRSSNYLKRLAKKRIFLISFRMLPKMGTRHFWVLKQQTIFLRSSIEKGLDDGTFNILFSPEEVAKLKDIFASPDISSTIKLEEFLAAASAAGLSADSSASLQKLLMGESMEELSAAEKRALLIELNGFALASLQDKTDKEIVEEFLNENDFKTKAALAIAMKEGDFVNEDGTPADIRNMTEGELARLESKFADALVALGSKADEAQESATDFFDTNLANNESVLELLDIASPIYNLKHLNTSDPTKFTMAQGLEGELTAEALGEKILLNRYLSLTSFKQG